MLKRFLIVVLCFSALVTSATGAQAAAKLVVQKTSTAGGGVYLTLQLSAGHQYRVDVGAPKHLSFSGLGGENYTYVSNQHLFTASKPFQLKGTTPKSFTVRQQIKGNVTGWILFMDVALVRGKTVTVRVYDLGKK